MFLTFIRRLDGLVVLASLTELVDFRVVLTDVLFLDCFS